MQTFLIFVINVHPKELKKITDNVLNNQATFFKLLAYLWFLGYLKVEWGSKPLAFRHLFCGTSPHLDPGDKHHLSVFSSLTFFQLLYVFTPLCN